jgi:hypothetical protein
MLNVGFRSGLLIALSGMALSACFDVGSGTDSGASGDPVSQSPENPAQGSTNPPGSPTGTQPEVTPPSSTTPPDTLRANVTPSIWGVAPTQVQAGARYEFKPRTSDTDGDKLRFTATGLPAWTTLDAASGLISGTPKASDAGQTADIVVSVSDGKDYNVLPAFRIVVTAAPAPPAAPPPASNTAPRISGAPGTSVQAQSGYSFRPTASDPEGQTLSFSIANKPAWAAFNTTTGTLSGTPARNQSGTYGSIQISVSDGSLTAALPAFAIVVSPGSNSAPTISGTPVTSLTTDTAYWFRPPASDPNGDALTFSISGRPAWADFNAANGALSGTPSSAQAGTYSNIVISVSDGHLTTSLPAFSIVVNRPTLGSATLSWSAPTQNTDGSAISNLSGYRIYYGTSAASLGTRIQVSNPGISTYVVDNLQSGTWYFAVSAYNSAGVEGARSTVGSKAIP